MTAEERATAIVESFSTFTFDRWDLRDAIASAIQEAVEDALQKERQRFRESVDAAFRERGKS